MSEKQKPILISDYKRRKIEKTLCACPLCEKVPYRIEVNIGFDKETGGKELFGYEVWCYDCKICVGHFPTAEQARDIWNALGERTYSAGKDTYCAYCNTNLSKSCESPMLSRKLQREYNERQNSYPYNLYYDMYGKRMKKITPEFERALDRALATLTDYQRDLIKRKYVEFRRLSSDSSGNKIPDYFMCLGVSAKIRQYLDSAENEKKEETPQ